MQFVQLIEFQTSRIDEFNALVDEWIKESEGWRAPTRALQTKDRDRPNTYMQIVEFPSYDEAMKNSDRPETAAFAERLAALCDGPPAFRNLDVEREELT
jgi:hypothetical protein